MTHTPLHAGWTLRGIGDGDLPRPVPASVPGCVHTDLLAAGLIDDPFLDDNELALGWIGHGTWEYETSFEWQPGDAQRLDLVCAGLDTVATVTINDVEIGATQNMHRSYRFDVRTAVRPGTNTLRIRFASAHAYAQEQSARLGPRPASYSEPFNFIRKMACNFGWDWGPTLVTAGIWQPIGLDAWSVARLASVRPLVTVDGSDGVVDLRVELERAGDETVVVAARVGAVHARVEVPAGAVAAGVVLRVPDVARWWPHGYGDQPLYAIEVDLSTPDGLPVDSWRRQVGFRSVRLDTTPDESGTPYTLIVNDVPIFVRGANWIPDDPFPSRITRDRLANRVTQAVGANINTLRVWGGGRYESEDFYELCDERGLLVAQDFLFACAAYPEEAPFAEEVAAEAAEQIVRLASHPSLVTWTGNNENLWGFADWDWSEPLAGRSWGAGYYFTLLPELVTRLDPTRPYWPGSPYSGSRDIHPNDPAHGSMHIWDVWNSDDYLKYREYAPRFVAEFGYQAPPTFATLRHAVSDKPLASNSPGVTHHQKAIDGDLKLQRGLDAHLPSPRDFDDWLYLTQLNQARAVQLGVEHFRALRGHCMGAIVWQLNDCWPVTSWAAIDGDGRLKPLWYALRRAYSDRLITVQPRDGGLAVVAVNDGPTHWVDQVAVTRTDLDGTPRAKTTMDISVPPGSACPLALPSDIAAAADPTTELIVVDANDTRAWWFFAEDKDIAYPAAEYDAAVEPVPGGYQVSVTARTVLRDLCLFPDRLDPAASVDEAMVTLLPQETVVFTVLTSATLDPNALTTRPVLRCVNDVSPGT
jgi:beta-mannosidase